MTVRWKSLSWLRNLEDSVEITFQEHAVFPLMNPFHIVVLQVMVHLSSGKIVFYDIANQEKMHGIISRLLIERQEKNAVSATIKQETPQSNADELRKYKELLDSGIITQEEFNAKKKQLLDL